MFFMIISTSTLKYLPFQLKEILLELFPQVQEPSPRVVQLSSELVSHLVSSANLKSLSFAPQKSPLSCHKQQPENLHEMR